MDDNDHVRYLVVRLPFNSGGSRLRRDPIEKLVIREKTCGAVKRAGGMYQRILG